MKRRGGTEKGRGGRKGKGERKGKGRRREGLGMCPPVSTPGSASVRYVKTAIFCTCGSNNWETVADRWVHAARGFASTELSFDSCNVLRDCHRGVSRANKK